MSHVCSICRGSFNKEPNTKSSDEQAEEPTSAATPNDEETARTSSTAGTPTKRGAAGSSSGTSSEDPLTKKAKPSNTEQTAQLVSPRCGHIFHRACLMALLDSGKKHCPVCNVICCEDLIKPVFLSVAETASPAGEPKEPEDTGSQNSGEPIEEDAAAEKTDEEKDAGKPTLNDEDKLQLQTQINADLEEQIEQVRAEKRVLRNRYDKMHAEWDTDNLTIITYMEAIEELKKETQELCDKLANKMKEVSKDKEVCKLLEISIKVMEEENKALEEDKKKLDEEEENVRKIVDKANESLALLGDLELKDLSENIGNMDDDDEDADEEDVSDQNEENSEEDGNESDDDDEEDQYETDGSDDEEEED